MTSLPPTSLSHDGALPPRRVVAAVGRAWDLLLWFATGLPRVVVGLRLTAKPRIGVPRPPRPEEPPERRRRKRVLRWGTLAVFAASLALFAWFRQETFYTQFERDPYLFRIHYPVFYDAGSWVAFHHHFHYWAWCAGYRLTGNVVFALELASLVPAAAAAALLWFGLVRERRVSPSTAALVTGLCVGAAPFWFYATTVETHAMQVLVSVAGGLIALRGARARTPVRRVVATAVAAIVLLAAHPLHALLLPFLVLLHAGRLGPPDSAKVPGAPRFLLRAIDREVIAVAFVLALIGALRYFEIHRNMEWSVGTLTFLAERAEPDPVAVELWRSFVRPHLWLAPFVALFLLRGERGRFSIKVRMILVAVWCTPLVALVVWIRLFENGGYFIALAPLFLLLLAGDGLRRLDGLVSSWSRARRAAVLPAAVVVGAVAAGTPQMVARFNPPLDEDQAALIETIRAETGREDFFLAFDDPTIQLLRMRAHRLTAPFSSDDAEFLGVTPDQYTAMAATAVESLAAYVTSGRTAWMVLAPEAEAGPGTELAGLVRATLTDAVDRHMAPPRRSIGRYEFVGPIRGRR